LATSTRAGGIGGGTARPVIPSLDFTRAVFFAPTSFANIPWSFAFKP
jgi:hypothetical protein